MIVPAPDSDDERLAVRAAAGDATAFEWLVARYQQRVFRLACRLTSETDAADVLQDTFLQVYRRTGRSSASTERTPRSRQ